MIARHRRTLAEGSVGIGRTMNCSPPLKRIRSKLGQNGETHSDLVAGCGLVPDYPEQVISPGIRQLASNRRRRG